MNNWNYPIGSDTPNAPWNEIDNPPIEVKVDVYITMTKCVTITTDKYSIDEDGNINFDDTELEKEVRNQVDLPIEDSNYKDWHNDEFIVEPC